MEQLKSTHVTSLLSDKAVLRYMKEGKIVIQPFIIENLGTSSYDVTLGKYFYRETTPEPGQGKFIYFYFYFYFQYK